MNIGITYDLRPTYLEAGYSEEETAEFDRPDTIAAIEAILRQLGYATERVGHVRQLAARLVQGERWDLVFNIAEGVCGFGREAQVPVLLDAFGLPYTFSEPLVLTLTLHKGMTKHVVRELGIPTPDFTVVETAADLEAIRLPFPLFAKPVAEGSSKGISEVNIVRTPGDLQTVCADLRRRFRQPVLVETFVPGRELTVGLVGTGSRARALGVMEIVLLDEAEPEVYSYANKAHYASRVRYRLVRGALAGRAIEVALQAWRGLGCRDGGRVDLRCNARGEPLFLEVNPLPGLHPQHSDLPILCRLLGIGYADLLDMIMTSARRRLTSAEPVTISQAPSRLGADGDLTGSGMERHHGNQAFGLERDAHQANVSR
jgi:D-alanine-D-alanine ligase